MPPKKFYVRISFESLSEIERIEASDHKRSGMVSDKLKSLLRISDGFSLGGEQWFHMRLTADELSLLHVASDSAAIGWIWWISEGVYIPRWILKAVQFSTDGPEVPPKERKWGTWWPIPA